MNAIEQYRALLVELGITADVAQYNGWRLRPDYIHIPHHALRGGIQSYRSAQVASRLLLNGQFEPHRATKLYFSKHPTRPLKPIDYLQGRPLFSSWGWGYRILQSCLPIYIAPHVSDYLHACHAMLYLHLR